MPEVIFAVKCFLGGSLIHHVPQFTASPLHDGQYVA